MIEQMAFQISVYLYFHGTDETTFSGGRFIKPTFA